MKSFKTLRVYPWIIKLLILINILLILFLAPGAFLFRLALAGPSVIILILLPFFRHQVKKITQESHHIPVPQEKPETERDIYDSLAEQGILPVETDFNKKLKLVKEAILSKEGEHPELIPVTHKLYYFKMVLPLIERLYYSTRDMEEKTLKSVFTRFESIWNESESIVSTSEETMKQIFDKNSKDNLNHVMNTSREISQDFTDFIPVLEHLEKLTDQFMSTAITSLHSIQSTTSAIEDLAEQVKVISINVRIEAARIKGESGGFNVLGSDISEFAEKTTSFARTTGEKVSDTVKEVTILKDELSEKLNMVSSKIKNIYSRITPFEEILESSTRSLSNIVNDLHRVSGEQHENIKGSLAQLQYQDVSSQETDHILQLLQSVETQNSECSQLTENLTRDKQEEIKESILKYIKQIITTGNEAALLEAFSREWGIHLDKGTSEDFDEVDDGTFLF